MILGAEDGVSKSPENRRFRLAHCRLTPRNPREYPHKCYIARNYSHWATSSSLIVWVYLHSNFRGGLRKTRVFCNRVHNGPSGSSKVVVFGSNRKRVCDFLLVINSNLGPILPRFRHIAGFLLRRATLLLFHPIFWVFPLD